LVKGNPISENGEYVGPSPRTKPTSTTSAPFVKLDPAQPITLGGTGLEIPEPSFQLEQLLQALYAQASQSEEDNDVQDQEVFSFDEGENRKGKEKEVIVIDEDDHNAFMDADGDIEMVDAFLDCDSGFKALASSKGKDKSATKPIDDWVHDPEWVSNVVPMMLPAPQSASRAATAALQRELRSMLKEQESASSLKELGWYMPPEFIGDNLFQWIVEMHSFDESIPIAIDMNKE
jgi:ubiquitin-conjugating enzyme E2 Q